MWFLLSMGKMHSQEYRNVVKIKITRDKVNHVGKAGFRRGRYTE